ncbi:MAG: acetate--CoA ligase [Bacteriovoracales bacterium]|nr:acetate--CoA ligase [Bacteriovoracales bacterium]
MSYSIKNQGDYEDHYQRALEDGERFWAQVAEHFDWTVPWKKVCSGGLSKGDMKWFEGARLNITANCLDRHLDSRGDKTALIFEPNDPEEKSVSYTYRELHRSVCKAASMLESLGVRKGDRVCLYMAMVPELLIAVLACARIGAVHSVVFGGFSAKALADRLKDARCSLLITNDAGMRGKKVIPLKDIADEALGQCPFVKNVIVHKRVGRSVSWKEGRDLWWHDLFEGQPDHYSPQELEANDPLFILYTSGSTGRPKGLVHACAGYMVWVAYTFQNIFQMGEDDVYWCTADIGWITGHSYMVYGPLLNGATALMFEGVPTFPDAGRFWEVVDKHRVSHFYTAPTAIRSLMGAGLEFVEKHSLSSLKVLGTVGEPVGEEAWKWYHENVGKGRCPIVDTWWQTETGGAMISTLAGVTKSKPCFAGRPMPGVNPVLMNERGEVVSGFGVSGNLCIGAPWPGMAQTIYGDHERFLETYFTTDPGFYFTGDGCRRDESGLLRITGRVDDVINVSGHRIGTAEVEDAINQSGRVVESAVVAFPHEVKGQGIYAYVVGEDDSDTDTDGSALKAHIRDKVSSEIGPFAKPDKIQIVRALPKTRSGKIMRRILRKIAEGGSKDFGDTSTLLDSAVVETIRERAL